MSVEIERTEKSKSSTLKIVLDILCIAVIVFTVVAIPLWCHYDSKCIDNAQRGDPLPLELKLMLTASVAFLPSLLWLAFRHFRTLHKKYPYTSTREFWILVTTGAIVVVMLVKTYL